MRVDGFDGDDLRADAEAYAASLAAQSPLPADSAVRSDRHVADWALESCRIARDGKLYPPGHVIGDDYLDAQRATMDRRLRRAGERLADLLNATLDPARRAGATANARR